MDVNLSTHKLTAKETDVVARVLNFAPAPEKVPKKDIIASVEPALRYHDSAAVANVARAPVCNILKKAKTPRENLSRDEKKALKSLRDDENIVVAKADKGKMTVVLNKVDYEKKASDIFQAGKFEKISSDRTKETERKLNQELKALLDRKVITKTLYNNVKASNG